MAVAIEWSVVRVAHYVLTEGVKAMQDVIRREDRELLAL